jgi:hypothetical protein
MKRTSYIRQGSKPTGGNGKSTTNNSKMVLRQPTDVPGYSIQRPLVDKESIHKKMKYSRMFQGILSITTSGDVVALSGLIPQGTTAVTRIGDNIKVKQLDCRFSITQGDTTNVCRLMCIYLKGTPTGSATISNFLESGAGGSADVQSFYSAYQNGKSFEVLYDEIVVVAQQWRQVQYRSFTIPVNRGIEYFTSTNNSAAGEVYFIALSDSAIAPNPVFYMNIKAWYTDA